MMVRMVCQALVDKLMSNDKAEDLTVQMKAAMSEELKMVPYAGARLSVVLSLSSSLIHISLDTSGHNCVVCVSKLKPHMTEICVSRLFWV